MVVAAFAALFSLTGLSGLLAAQDDDAVVSTKRVRDRQGEVAVEAGTQRGAVGNGVAAWTAQSPSVAGEGDVADDPAIWVDESNPSASVVIGTDKDNSEGGLYVYGLDGAQRQHLPIGRMNNVDLRYGVELGGASVDIVGASNRTTDAIDLFRVTSNGTLEEAGSVPAGFAVYGFCMYRPAGGPLFAIVTSERGQVEQYALAAEGNSFTGQRVRAFSVGSSSEGCVADDAAKSLFIAEEGKGIWKYGADPASGSSRTQVDDVGSGHLTADVEGLAIYETGETSGYLVASSQGDSTFAVYERAGAHRYLGSFRVEASGDAVTETDGIAVTSADLGGALASGLLVAHDASTDASTSNYKLVPWANVAGAIALDGGVSTPAPPQPTPSPSSTPSPSPTSSSSPAPAPNPSPGPGAVRPSLCQGIQVASGANLPALVNGASGKTFCLAPGTYNIGTASISPGSNTKLIGAPVAVDGLGAVSAPTKIVGTSPNGVIAFTKPASGVVIENLDICCAGGTKSDSDNSTKKQGRGINGFTGNATNLTVRYSRIHGNANAGIGGIGSGALIERVELDDNGSESYVGCCAGGIKSANLYTIRFSYVHDNIGNGIWVDAGGSFVVTDNVVVRNTKNGIRYENSSGYATILRNRVQGNSTSGDGPGGGIEVNSADDAEVANNILGQNSNAGIIFRGNRGPVGGVVYGNTLNGDVIKGCDVGNVRCSA